MNYDEIKRLSAEQRDNPSPGDYWHEMFSPVCVVLAVSSIRGVVVCKKIKWPDPNHWTWDLEHTVTMRGDSFANFVSYGYDRNHKLGCCANVVPNGHEWAIECWRDAPAVSHVEEVYPK